MAQITKKQAIINFIKEQMSSEHYISIGPETHEILKIKSDRSINEAIVQLLRDKECNYFCLEFPVDLGHFQTYAWVGVVVPKEVSKEEAMQHPEFIYPIKGEKE